VSSANDFLRFPQPYKGIGDPFLASENDNILTEVFIVLFCFYFNLIFPVRLCSLQRISGSLQSLIEMSLKNLQLKGKMLFICLQVSSIP